MSGCNRQFEIVVREPLGDLVDIITTEYSARWTLRANKVGALIMELPVDYCGPVKSYGFANFPADARIELRRTIDGDTSLVGNTTFFVNYAAIQQTSDGRRVFRVEAESALGLAGRRIVAYHSNDNACDLLPLEGDRQLHRIMRDHFSFRAGSYNLPFPPGDPMRQAIDAYLLIVSNTLMPVLSPNQIEMNIAHQPVLQSLNRIADSSFEKGEPLFFDIVQISDTGLPFLEFVTAFNQLGTDRTYATGGTNRVVLDALGGGPISDYTFSFDYRDSANRVWAGSQGRGATQVFVEKQDPALAALVAADPFILREAYISTNELVIDTAKIGDQAGAELTRLQPKVDLHGSLTESETFVWGVDWDYHDRITVMVDGGNMFDAHIETLDGELSEGRETISGTFATSLHRSLDGLARIVQDTRRHQWWINHLNALEAS